VEIIAVTLKLLIDSGAFSAWKLGKAVDFDRYCAFLEANRDWIDSYINLDHIIPENPEEAARRSFENLERMRDRGLEPMAVYHAREDIAWLDRILDLDCRSVGIAGRSLPTDRSREEFYQMAWERLVDGQGRPVARVHGLGETREEILLRYPWASADSTTWLNGQRYGWFRVGNHRLGHTNKPNSERRHDLGSNHADVGTLDGEDKVIFDRLLASAGLPRSILSERTGTRGWVARAYLEAQYWGVVEARIRERGARRHQVPRGLLQGSVSARRRPAVLRPFDLFLGTAPSNGTIAISYRAGTRSLLLSYYYIAKMNPSDVGMFRDMVEDFDAALGKWPVLGTQFAKIDQAVAA
jgi:hypothetical protein